MKAASVVMSSGKNMELAGKAASKGRFLGGKTRRIGHIPLPIASIWTAAHDVPAPPAKSFRQWWAEEGQNQGKGAR